MRVLLVAHQFHRKALAASSATAPRWPSTVPGQETTSTSWWVAREYGSLRPSMREDELASGGTVYRFVVPGERPASFLAHHEHLEDFERQSRLPNCKDSTTTFASAHA